MRHDRLLDLHRGDVLAPGDDDVLGTVEQLTVAVWVDDSEVSGMKSAAGERTSRVFGLAEVALHDDVAAHDDFAHLGSVRRYVDEWLVGGTRGRAKRAVESLGLWLAGLRVSPPSS